MNILDLPWLVILAGWLYRRACRPPKSPNPIIRERPIETYLSEIAAVERMLATRHSQRYIESNWITRVCHWYIERYKRQKEAEMEMLKAAGVDEVIMIRKGDSE